MKCLNKKWEQQKFKGFQCIPADRKDFKIVCARSRQHDWK